jgi:hypothetical protein
MTDKRLSVPQPGVRELAHRLAFKIAREQLAALVDIDAQCRKSGGRYLPAEKAVIIKHLNRDYKLALPDAGVTYVDTGEAVPLRDKILILHYFLNSRGTPLSGRMITYKELQEGINYYPTFFKRAIEPVVNNFKDVPEKLLEVTAGFGGKKVEYGDTAVAFSAFPYVPLTIVLWSGDPEFPPDGNILFDSTISDYLPTEDITILCEMIAWRLVRFLKTGGDSSGHR